MIKNVKIRVIPEETAKIQKVVFDNNGYWDNKTKICDWIIITIAGNIAWATTNDLKRYSEIDAKDWLQDAISEFPIYKMHEYERYIVRFDDVYAGEVVWIKSKSETVWKVGEYSNAWIEFTDRIWLDVDINLYLSTTQPAIPSKYDEQEQEIVQEDIQPGTIVKATRKSNSDKFEDYSWQGTYFGYCNGKHLIDANTTHVQLADEVLLIPTLTKKEAKQKISELFSQSKNVTSDKVRNIIDLIKD